MTYIMGISIGLLLSCLACVYHYAYSNTLGLEEIMKRNHIRGVFSFSMDRTMLFLCILLVGVLFGWIYQKSNDKDIVLISWQILLSTLALIALVDFQKKLIPNKLIVLLFAAGFAVMTLQLLMAPNDYKRLLLQPIMGLLLGGGIMLVANLLTKKKGVGGGDVKLFAAIGFVMGFVNLLGVMFYCFFFSAVVSLGLLLFRKVKIHDSIAMAPFAFLGALSSIVLLVRNI